MKTKTETMMLFQILENQHRESEAGLASAEISIHSRVSLALNLGALTAVCCILNDSQFTIPQGSAYQSVFASMTEFLNRTINEEVKKLASKN